MKETLSPGMLFSPAEMQKDNSEAGFINPCTMCLAPFALGSTSALIDSLNKNEKGFSIMLGINSGVIFYSAAIANNPEYLFGSILFTSASMGVYIVARLALHQPDEIIDK